MQRVIRNLLFVMRKSVFFFSLMLSSMVSFQVLAWTSPVSLPDVGNGRLRVIGQNTQNYFLDISNSFSSCNTEEELLDKTDKMANAFVALNPDIVALCEVEDCDSVLGLLAAHMNTAYGSNVFTYIADRSSSTYTKVGYVYRKDKVEPFRSTYSATSSYSYQKRLRVQAFKELSTDEMFTLSMNHFKAFADGESQRIDNAQDLINTLGSSLYDPDVLIMGDLNAQRDETCIIMLENAGYAEQLLRFNPSAYSYIYYGEYELIDHVMANSSMTTQLTGAQVYHINTYGWPEYRYSDHDCCLVGINLGSIAPPDTDTIVVPPVKECPHYEYDFRSGFSGFVQYNVSGNTSWKEDATYGAKITAYTKSDNQEHWLVSPELDMSGALSAELTINHNIYKDDGVTGDYVTDQTVWVSTDYVDGNLPSTANWQQMTLSAYPLKTFGDATAAIPSSCLKEGVHIAFKYLAPLAANGNYWEIKTADITAVCDTVPEPSAVEMIEKTQQPAAHKVFVGGRILIEHDGQIFDLMGNRLK